MADYSNKTYGEIDIIRKATPEEKDQYYTKTAKRTVYQCKCRRCGKIFYDNVMTIVNGQRTTCGCLRRPDLTGLRFGSLIVMGDSGERKDKKKIWNCKCDCGNTTTAFTQQLNSGIKTSCGCRIGWQDAKEELMRNKRYGKLTVLEATDKRVANSIVWKCQCDCGAIHYVDTNSLNSGKTTSCGCNKSQGEEKIAKILSDNGIPFEREKTFPQCVNPETNKKFRFDFWVNNEYIIEYDGAQHFISSNQGWNTEEQLEKTRYRDAFKNKWCEENNIKIIRIPYTKFDNLTIEDLV